LTRSLRSAALVAAVAIAFADSSIVVLALPELLKQYDVSINATAWVVTGYNVALAVGALALRRFEPRLLAFYGSVGFVVASLACAVAPEVWVLIVFRVLQGVAGAALLVGALPVLSSLLARGVSVWAGAGIFGAALGPALGGALTEAFSWRAIFYAQAPVAAVAAVALLRVQRVPPEPAHRPRLASVALAFVSAALVGVLFLAVVQLVDVWRLSPLGAGAVVSVIPLATLAAVPFARRASAAGAVLLAAGLAGMAFMPDGSLVWVVVALAVAGLGFGLVMPALTQTTTGATAVAIRHAGLVAGLLVITPLLTSDLTSAADKAKLRGIATTLDAPGSISTKIKLAVNLAPVLSRPPRKELPNFAKAVAHEHDPALTAIGRRLDHVVKATVTRGFRGAFLVAAAFALLAAAMLVGRGVRTAAAAALVGLALVGAELAAGGTSYGTQPKLYRACADRPSEAALLKVVDFLACRLHKSREQFVADAAGAGVDAAEFVKRIERLASLLGR
jgi:MFS family permease